jgi:hypothetical protein
MGLKIKCEYKDESCPYYDSETNSKDKICFDCHGQEFNDTSKTPHMKHKITWEYVTAAGFILFMIITSILIIIL